MSHCYEIYAIKYATVQRIRRTNFLHPVDGDPNAPMALDFFVWLVVGPGTVMLVDTGFSPASGLVRDRQYLVGPVESLARLGYSPQDVQDVVITHLHYDHAGNVGDFPQARVWVQDREVRYATGDCMCDPKQNHFFSTDDISVLIKRLFAGNVKLVDGYREIRDGIELHRVGGHTDGLQVVRVRSSHGWVLLASDAAHYYENLAKENPFPAIFSLEDMLAGYTRIRQLVDDERFIVPGHDPEVCTRFPQVDRPGIYAYRIA